MKKKEEPQYTIERVYKNQISKEELIKRIIKAHQK